MVEKLRIGTRGSQLAMVQAKAVATKIVGYHPDTVVEIVKIKTSGDWKPEQGEKRLSTLDGGKAQFAKEIEQAILDGEIDCGVHSAKDMASDLPDGLVMDRFLPREDPRDAFLSNDYKTIDDLPEGAVVGTASLRRQAMLLSRRPDLKIVPYRGNVPTRIEKLRNGQVDATILAYAGLKRLGLQQETASIIPPDTMLPAAGQGAIGIEYHTESSDVAALLNSLHCKQTGLSVAAERAVLQAIGGSCHTPIGAYATIEGDQLSLKAAIYAPDGSDSEQDSAAAKITSIADAHALGSDIGARLKDKAPASWIDHHE